MGAGAVGKVNATGRSKSGPKHVRLYEFELNCAAYKALSVYGRAVLVELRRRFNGSNNGNIVLSVRQAATALGCHRDTAAKALDECVATGWAKRNTKAGFNWKSGTATTWYLTNEPIGDETATKDYMRWQPEKKQTAVLRDRTLCPTKPDTSHPKTLKNTPKRPKRSDTFGKKTPSPVRSGRTRLVYQDGGAADPPDETSSNQSKKAGGPSGRVQPSDDETDLLTIPDFLRRHSGGDDDASACSKADGDMNGD